MTNGDETQAHDRIEALIGAAAPGPVPADQALVALRGLVDAGAATETVGRLAYHALTGVAPGGKPVPPQEVAPGFPPFAGEVLMRAMDATSERQPTPAALLVVLETVPAGSWPAPATPVEVEPEADAELETDAEPETEPEPEADAGEDVDPEPRSGRAGMHAEFRAIVAPPRPVPRFEPLEGAGQLPGVSVDPDRPSRTTGAQAVRRRSTSTSHGTSSDDRRQTLVVVAVLLVLIVAGALWAAYGMDEPEPASDDLTYGAPHHRVPALAADLRTS